LHAKHLGSLFLSPRPIDQGNVSKNQTEPAVNCFAMATTPKTRDTHAVRTRRVPVRLCSWPSGTA
jgi:hypothetical protein